MADQQTTWTESEERRRTHWGIFILDRAVSAGSRKPSALPDPSPSAILPCDDDGWDAGDLARCLMRPLSSPLSDPVSPFARTVQAAVALSKATAYVRTHHDLVAVSAATDVAAALALAEEISRLAGTLDDNLEAPSRRRALAPARAFAWGALLAVLDAHCCPESLLGGPGRVDGARVKTADELALQVRSVEGMSRVSVRVQQFGAALVVSDEGDHNEEERVSPFVLDCMYCAQATFHWLFREGGSGEVGRSLEDLHRTMVVLSKRWRLAGEYLAMEIYHDVNARVRQGL
jgi:hypothetical protein